MTPPSQALTDRGLEVILQYLEHGLRQYPFDPKLDQSFIEELISDYPEVDVLEQIKMFRWYYDDRPPLSRQPRATLRRWIVRAARMRRSS